MIKVVWDPPREKIIYLSAPAFTNGSRILTLYIFFWLPHESHQVRKDLVHCSWLCLLPSPSAIVMGATPPVNRCEMTLIHLGHI